MRARGAPPPLPPPNHARLSGSLEGADRHPARRHGATGAQVLAFCSGASANAILLFCSGAGANATLAFCSGASANATKTRAEWPARSSSRPTLGRGQPGPSNSLCGGRCPTSWRGRPCWQGPPWPRPAQPKAQAALSEPLRQPRRPPAQAVARTSNRPQPHREPCCAARLCR